MTYCLGILELISLPINRFRNKIAPNILNNTLKIPYFCSFASFLVVLLTPCFFNKPESPRDLTIFIIPSISSFEIINAAISNLRVSLCIHACAVAVIAVSPNGIKSRLANGISTFFSNEKPGFLMVLEIYLKIFLTDLF